MDFVCWNYSKSFWMNLVLVFVGPVIFALGSNCVPKRTPQRNSDDSWHLSPEPAFTRIESIDV
jgi:hypothetical protein